MNKKPNKEGKKKISLKYMLIIAAVLTLLLMVVIGSSSGSDFVKGSISYTDFLQDVEDNEIDSLLMTGGYMFKAVYKDGKGLEDRFDDNGEKIELELEDGKRVESVIVVSTEALQDLVYKGVDLQYKKSNPEILYLILTYIPTMLIIILLAVYIKMMFGKTKSPKGSLKSTTPTVLFTDVAGMTEEKEEMLFAINSLKNPEEYEEKGVKPIRGILLEGPPGVGKTLLAKAVAGEAGVNFLSFSGSDFVEMFAGMGASRVRRMYKQAEELKPCVVFVDEIDALGRKRTNGGNGGTQEADQTLVALLERMDGMNTTSGILFIGATNRVDTLDSALLRPGRFDKIIHVGPPKTKEDREAIVRVHIGNKTLEDGVTVEKVAKQCYGMTGAEIASSLNDSVLESFKDNRGGVISLDDIDKAIMKLAARGLAKGRHSEEDRHRVAVHETGHALMNLELGRDVIKVSIQPYSSGIGGVTVIDGESKGVEGLRKASDLRNDIKVLYAGKVAEEILLGECSVGASNDLERATYLLRDYVGAYGMQKGSILSLVGLAKENMLITANEELLKKMEVEGQKIYTEVVDYLSNPKVQEKLHKVVEHLTEVEVIYEIESVLNSSSDIKEV